jgi:23S rRNA-/tRNA-specific pseudouridylate synthase
MAAASKHESTLRDDVLRLTFRSLPGGARSPVGSVARQMGLPASRVEGLLMRAMRAYPMPGDPEGLEVLLEDDDILAVSKPPGLNTAPVHRFRGGSMVNRCITHLGRPPFVVHRLDMDTSGVLLFAKTRHAATAVARQFRARSVAKWYLALCIGVPSEGTFEVDAPIGRHPTVQVARVVGDRGAGGARGAGASAGAGAGADADEFGGGVSRGGEGSDSGGDGSEGGSASGCDDALKPARTSFVVLATNLDADLASVATPGELFDPRHAANLRGACLLACRPHTGRTHQIRVHAQAAGHPLLGDELYGVVGPWLPRHGLHATALLLDHPSSRARCLTLVAPLPDDMAAALRALQLAVPSPEQLLRLVGGGGHDDIAG